MYRTLVALEKPFASLHFFLRTLTEEDTELQVKDEGFWEEGNALPGCILRAVEKDGNG